MRQELHHRALRRYDVRQGPDLAAEERARRLELHMLRIRSHKDWDKPDRDEGKAGRPRKERL